MQKDSIKGVENEEMKTTNQFLEEIFEEFIEKK